MKNRNFRIISIIFVIIFAALILKSYDLYKKNMLLEKKVEQLNIEKVKTYTEMELCLKQNEKFLKKELVDKYSDSLISLRNKIEKGYVPDENETSIFMDRIDFIISNLELLDLPGEKVKQYIYFTESMRKLLGSFSSTENKNKQPSAGEQ